MRPELDRTADEIEKVITGKRDVIEKILTALLADGHVLLDDVPGVGKTTLAAALCRAVGLERRRVQFTPDVMPSDLVGFSMYRKERDEFEYRPGALNGIHLLLADEINRASGRTQSALLEAMEERRVTVGEAKFTPAYIFPDESSGRPRWRVINPLDLEQMEKLSEAQQEKAREAVRLVQERVLSPGVDGMEQSNETDQ